MTTEWDKSFYFTLPIAVVSTQAKICDFHDDTKSTMTKKL